MKRFKKIPNVAESSPASDAAFTCAVTLANPNQAERIVVGVENITPSERSRMSAKVREKVFAHRLGELEQQVNDTKRFSTTLSAPFLR